MSIQEAREAIAKNQGALLKADGPFFRSIENRYQAIKDKGAAHPADLRRLQSEIGNWLTTLVNKADWNASADQGPYDGAMAWNALLGAEIDLLLVAGAMPGNKAKKGGWINAETGNPVEVFASTEQLASGERNEGPSVGQHLEAILSGAKTPEIKASLSEGVDSAGRPLRSARAGDLGFRCGSDHDHGRRHRPGPTAHDRNAPQTELCPMTDDIAIRSAANGAQARLLAEASSLLADFYQTLDPSLSDAELLSALVQGYRDHMAWMQAKGAALAEEEAALRRAVGVDLVH